MYGLYDIISETSLLSSTILLKILFPPISKRMIRDFAAFLLIPVCSINEFLKSLFLKDSNILLNYDTGITKPKAKDEKLNKK